MKDTDQKKGWNPEAGSAVHRAIEEAIYVVRLHRTVLEKKLHKTGVYRSQHQILMDISRFPEASQKDIATRHHVSTATIAVSLKKLEKGGYIKREVNQNDNRFNHIRITEKGAMVVEESYKIFHEVENLLFAGFSEEEVKTAEGFLERMRNNLLTAAPNGKREE